MKKVLLKACRAVQVSALVLSMVATSTTALAEGTTGMWLKGDFHTHTYISDGSYTATEVAAKAKEYGLDWYSATDHGGSSVGGRDENGTAWAQDTAGLVNGKLPRWASILGIGEDEINNNRKSILQFTGFEWNVPTHEHASIGMVGDSATVTKQLAIFDYLFDGTAEAWNNTNPLFTGLERSIEGKAEMVQDKDGKWVTSSKKLTNNTHMGALRGAEYLQTNFPTTSYFLPNHPSRALNYTVADFKEFNDIAPDVCFGAELLPGHQASAYRGGLGYVTAYDGVLKKNVNIASSTGTTLLEKLDAYIAGVIEKAVTAETDTTKKESVRTAKTEAYAAVHAAMLTSLQNNVAKQRTYGGADYLLAKVGGGWDTLLSEGRHFWVFGNSDFHIDSEKAATQPGSEPDFWPGEYSKNYTYTYGKDYQSILDGMRSGNSFTALGDLINALDYNITNNTTSATMGETITPVKGKDTVVTIRFKSPAKNNNGDTPVVDHIDVIAGQVKGEPAVKYVDSSKTAITSFEDPKVYLTKEYQNDDVTATTKVIRTFNKSEFKTDKDGYSTVTFTIPATDKDMYYRLRGTNNAVGTANVDANGNPTIDTAVDVFKGDNTEEKAYDDLWFYSNPIFVNAQVDGATVTGTLKDTAGNILANKTVELDTDAMITTTDASGKYTFHNVEMGIHTLYVKNASGEVESQMTFNLQRGQTTQFAQGDVWIKTGISTIQLNFIANGANMSISDVKEIVPSENPKTGDSTVTIALAMFVLAGIGTSALKISGRPKKAKESK